MTKNKKIINTIDFAITMKCNYKCPYCDQGADKKKYEAASDEVVDAFIRLLRTEQFKNWGIIQLVGGEPTIHKRFWDLVNVIVETGNKFQICTNFSQNSEFYEKLIKLSGDKFHRMQISFHPSQIRDIDEFITKIFKFNKNKHKDTIFIISSVLTEENFEQIKYLKSKLDEKKLKIELQHQRTTEQKFVQYPQELDSFIKRESNVDFLDFSKEINPFGLKCHTGINFFTLCTDGSANRCYGNSGFLTSLGNIKNGTFSTYKHVMPCLSEQCTCTLPAQCGMIDFENKNIIFSKFLRKIKSKKVKKIIRYLIGLKN